MKIFFRILECLLCMRTGYDPYNGAPSEFVRIVEGAEVPQKKSGVAQKAQHQQSYDHLVNAFKISDLAARIVARPSKSFMLPSTPLNIISIGNPRTSNRVLKSSLIIDSS